MYRLRLVLVILVTWAVFAVAQKNQYVTHPTPQAFNCIPGLKDGDLFYHAHPDDPTKFIQCDQFGTAFIQSCPRGLVWNQSFLTCIRAQENDLDQGRLRGMKPPESLKSPYIRWEQRLLNCIYNMTVVDPTNNQYLTSPRPLDFNCTFGLQTGDMFYHPYPNDHNKCIQCDQFGNAFVKSCQTGRIWNQYLLTCIPSGIFSGSGEPVGK